MADKQAPADTESNDHGKPEHVSWWGKVLGGAFGLMLGGPLGMLIGAALGHGFDRGVERAGELPPGSGFDRRERTQMAFFTATFSVMGHISKSDGRVTPEEIALASDVMRQLSLNPELRTVAQRLFTEGKRAGFPLEAVLEQFRRECHRSSHLIRMFVEIQLHAAYADGSVHAEERRILEHVCHRLGVSRSELDQLETLVQAGLHYRQGAGAPSRARMPLDEAHGALGVSEDSSDEEVKKAYRRLMSQHHPDKLVAKGLPEEMMRLAKEKTQEIKAAYERVKEARGLR
ncbi:MAG TPA: co-chaperone DjlA [Gammaproteobacteria bacterium]|nr:co-chaperone DjlA [Gammaproteobacteria bacterium]